MTLNIKLACDEYNDLFVYCYRTYVIRDFKSFYKVGTYVEFFLNDQLVGVGYISHVQIIDIYICTKVIISFNIPDI